MAAISVEGGRRKWWATFRTAHTMPANVKQLPKQEKKLSTAHHLS